MSGEITAFRPWPGYDTEPTTARPPQEANELLSFARSAGDRTEEHRLNPDTHGYLLKEIFEAGFTVAVDDRSEGPDRIGRREFAEYLESIGWA